MQTYGFWLDRACYYTAWATGLLSDERYAKEIVKRDMLGEARYALKRARELRLAGYPRY